MRSYSAAAKSLLCDTAAASGYDHLIHRHFSTIKLADHKRAIFEILESGINYIPIASLRCR